MPRMLTHNDLPLSTPAPPRASRNQLFALAALALIGLATLGGYALTRRLTAPETTALAPARAGLDKAALAGLDLSGFQRRGNVLIGETTTRAGVRLRLVLDARSHDLVGLRVVETEAGTPER